MAREGGTAAGPTPPRVGRRAQVAGQLRLIGLAAWRAVGELYSVVSAGHREDVDDDAPSFELGDAFDVDPRDEPGPGAHLFAAPDVCSCTCDAGDGADDVDDAP